MNLTLRVALTVSFAALAGRMPGAELRYVAIGDSYSIGEGAGAENCWPALLATNLTKAGIPTVLVANPSRTGWTTSLAIQREIPIAREAKPDFLTIQIGVNDWVQHVDRDTFRANFIKLLDLGLALLPDPRRVLLVNIPDFSVTPGGQSFGDPGEISRGIAVFNEIIAEEGARRGIPVVDIFPLSLAMGHDPTLVSRDSLHPSAKEYAEWEKHIFPRARELLQGSPP